jgi:hypothetical protein
MFRLSQGYLNLLQTCPRKFQHIYFDQLGSPISPEQQEKQTWGSQFHLVMQQRELGLPVEFLVEEDPQLQRWVTSLIGAAPDISIADPQTFRHSEHCRTLNLQGYLLTVIYDLLIADPQQAQIIDWKTYPQPQHRRWLEKDWQTRLYLYVLAETSDYLLEQISMTYWFVQSQPQPQSLKFTYDRTRHQQTQADLTYLLNQLTDWLQSYQELGADLPQVAEAAGRCSDCSFAVRCGRSSSYVAGELPAISDDPTDLLLNLDAIEEVIL